MATSVSSYFLPSNQLYNLPEKFSLMETNSVRAEWFHVAGALMLAIP